MDTDVFIHALRKPLRSARATPIITTMIVMSGGKVPYPSSAVPTAMRSPSRLMRFLTVTVSPSLTTDTPAAAMTALTTASIAQRIQKSQKGWGSLLPTFSTAFRARMTAGSRCWSVSGPAWRDAEVDMVRPRFRV